MGGDVIFELVKKVADTPYCICMRWRNYIGRAPDETTSVEMLSPARFAA